ncbi:MAG: type II secretion system protein [Deltaproteobacteria bacterium]|nr:type II secretion system protein [Deltaproteobacteria bacterium]
MRIKNLAGFTTMELITVISILAILTGIAIVTVGNPRQFQAIAEAEALKANLRFTQSKAMADLPGNVWSLNVDSGSYTLLRNGAAPVPAVNIPGTYSGTYTLPSGVSVTGGTGSFRFNFRGQPVNALGVPLAADQSLSVYGAPQIFITRQTGFIP